MRCCEDGPCSTLVNGTMYTQLAACAFARFRRPKAQLRKTLTAPPHAALPCGGDRPVLERGIRRIFSKQKHKSLPGCPGKGLNYRRKEELGKLLM